MKVLVVIDMQVDFITGVLGTPQAREIVPNVLDKIAWARRNGYNIYFTKDVHGDNYLSTAEGINLPVPHCIKGSGGEEILPEFLEGIERPKIYEKQIFASTYLSSWLPFEYVVSGKEIDEVIFVGVCTDICVISNVLLLKAYLPGVKITVDAECCAGTTPEMHEKALDVMTVCQINVENRKEN